MRIAWAAQDHRFGGSGGTTLVSHENECGPRRPGHAATLLRCKWSWRTGPLYEAVEHGLVGGLRLLADVDYPLVSSCGLRLQSFCPLFWRAGGAKVFELCAGFITYCSQPEWVFVKRPASACRRFRADCRRILITRTIETTPLAIFSSEGTVFAVSRTLMCDSRESPFVRKADVLHENTSLILHRDEDRGHLTWEPAWAPWDACASPLLASAFGKFDNHQARTKNLDSMRRVKSIVVGPISSSGNHACTVGNARLYWPVERFSQHFLLSPKKVKNWPNTTAQIS